MTHWNNTNLLAGSVLVFGWLAASASFAHAQVAGMPSAAVPNLVAPSSVPPLAHPKHTISYTVVAGDTLTNIARKFNTTRKHLEALNDLASSKVKPGQLLLIPSTKNGTAASALAAGKVRAKKNYLMAQPVQDFDVPASTFASCPVPLPSPEDDAPVVPLEKPAPVAQLVSPADAAAEEEKERAETETQPIASNVPPVTTPSNLAGPDRQPKTWSRSAAPDGMAHHFATAEPLPPAPLPYNPPAPRFNSRPMNSATLAPNADSQIAGLASADGWGSRFLQQARVLGDRGIEYDDDWRPPGESRAWTMDCSNTSRYLYQVTTGIKLPRTASDQYYYLHLQGKAWDVPSDGTGLAECEFLRHHLKPGDLLFWENTYRPERQPPITHVMVFLGTNNLGQWIMAGSQSSRGGEHNRRNGGPDVYVFRPTQPCGGYTTWLGMVRHRGRFCAFGRPLEADPTKLAVATDD